MYEKIIEENKNNFTKILLIQKGWLGFGSKLLTVSNSRQLILEMPLSDTGALQKLLAAVRPEAKKNAGNRKKHYNITTCEHGIRCPPTYMHHRL